VPLCFAVVWESVALTLALRFLSERYLEIQTDLLLELVGCHSFKSSYFVLSN
jgi:hypothetical protein